MTYPSRIIGWPRFIHPGWKVMLDAGRWPITAPHAENVQVSGVFITGQELTASYTYQGSNPESGSAYQWYVADDDSGTNMQAILGATSLTYTLTVNEDDKFIGFGVVPSDGTNTGSEVLSQWYGPVVFTLESLYANGLYGGGLWMPKRLNNGVQMMYQDAAGTIPVVSDGDPVGLVIDRSQGYDRGVVNLFSYSEDISNAIWTKTRAIVSGPSIVDTTADNNHYVQCSNPPTGLSFIGKRFCFSATVSANAQSWVQLATPVSESADAWQNFNLIAGVTGNGGSNPSLTSGIQSIGSGLFLIWISWVATQSTQSGNIFLTNGTDSATRSPSYAGTNTGINVFSVQLETGSVPSAHQPKTNTLAEGGNHLIQEVAGSRPAYKTDGTYEWLLPDGIDDFMVTAGDVDMKGSVASSSFASFAVSFVKTILGLSADPATTSGTTQIHVASNNLLYRHRGSTNRTILAGNPTLGQILTASGRGSIATPNAQLYMDGTLIDGSNLSQGSGTLINAPVYLMALGGTSNFMNTPLYGAMLISRYLDDAQMLATSNYFAGLHP